MFIQAVDRRITTVLDQTEASFAHLEADAQAFVFPARVLLRGGKRMRARLAALGWQTVIPNTDPVQTPALITLGSALEFYQGSALVHDDVIDDADTRRSNPAVHRQFATLARKTSFVGDPDVLGRNSAILLGDLLMSLADAEFMEAQESAPGDARQQWTSMCQEVAFGQYLDLQASTAPLPSEGDAKGYESAIERALTVIRHKSAHYSVAHPVVVGALLAGATPALVESLWEFGEVLGEAFQLRDDELGIFGDPQITGKPAGDDVAEGKRTPLVLLALSMTHGAEHGLLKASLGERALSPTAVEQIRTILIDCGARDRHEDLIRQRRDEAIQLLEKLRRQGTDSSVLLELSGVTDALTVRNF